MTNRLPADPASARPRRLRHSLARIRFDRPGRRRTAAAVLGAAWLAACSAAPRIEIDPASAAFHEKAQLIMTKEEDALWKHLVTAADREEFIRDFWSIRDPDPETTENEAKKEFERRVDYAARHFSWNSLGPEPSDIQATHPAAEPGRGWNSDMGRVYIILGHPDIIRTYLDLDGYTGLPETGGNPWDANKAGLVQQQWYYRRLNSGLWFRKLRTGSWVFDAEGGASGILMEALEKGKVDLLGLQLENQTRRAFRFEAEFATDRLLLDIEPRRLNFTDAAGDKLTAKIRVRVNVYRDGGKVETLERDIALEETAEALVENKPLTVEIPYRPAAPGKYLFDIQVRDMLADSISVNRGIVKAKVSGK